jgi:integrase
MVSGSGRRKWVLRYQLKGVRRDLGLGGYPAEGLADARIAAADARKALARGDDPLEARTAARRVGKSIPVFGEIAQLVIADAQQKSTNAKVRYQWELYLGPAYSGPLLARPVNEITARDVAAVLKPVWHDKPEAARKLYPAIRRVFEYARVRLRDDHGVSMPENPARWDDLKAIGFEPPRKLSKGRHGSLPYDQLPAFMADLRARSAIAARALEFLVLTNVRTDAVLKAQWEDIDLDQALWTVPLVSLKDRQHRQEGFRVPLSDRAIEIVRLMNEARTSDYIFPAPRAGRPLSNITMLALLQRMNGGGPKWIDPTSKRPITPHGFRATFRTWAEETTSSPHAVIEEAMGHQVGTQVERAYRRTDVLAKRRELMAAWARSCEPPASGQVISSPRQPGVARHGPGDRRQRASVSHRAHAVLRRAHERLFMTAM